MTGFSPEENDIISIQTQELDSNGNPIGELIILKSWLSNEEQIIKDFYKIFVKERLNPFDFIFIMQNSLFDFRFLINKFKKYNLDIGNSMDFCFSYPVIDLRTTLIIANNMQFKGSGLSSMTLKKTDGKMIPEYFKSKEYDKIVEYIVQETESFIKAFQIIIEHNKTLKSKLLEYKEVDRK
jgi:hypothetical protein